MRTCSAALKNGATRDMLETDLRKFRFSRLNTDEFRHMKLLLFWPVFGLLFTFVERFYKVQYYTTMHCALDDAIPFCEWFLIPYLFWFIYLIGTLVYTFFFDVYAFKRMMYFIIITYSVTMLIYFLFPTCQNLRPAEFLRDNALTRFISWFYRFDTNTNVCPSIHVLGSVAAMFGLLDCRRLQKPLQKLLFIVLCVLICISTVFMKQHSVLDVMAALPLCAIAYPICYRTKRREKIGIA